MKNKLKSLILLLTFDIILYLLIAMQEKSLSNWSEMSVLHFQAYLMFSFVLTVFYYIDKEWKKKQK